MRNNHDKKNHKLVKRAFALCLALAVICSCLLPVFATETAGVATMQEQGGVAVQMDGGFGVDPSNPGSGSTESGSTPVTDPSSVAGVTFPDGATNIVKNPNGSYSYDTKDGHYTVYPDADKVDMGDGTVKPNPNMAQDDAAFGVLPIEYHFWLKQMDNFDLGDLAWEAEMSGQSETEYLVMFGSSDKFPIWHMDTISSVDTISNYQFDDPTSLNDPEKKGREFAGWYTVDSTGLKHEFDPYQSYGSTSNTVVNVFAAWKDASGDVVDDTKKDEEAKEEDTKKEEESKSDETKKDEESKKDETAKTVDVSGTAKITENGEEVANVTVTAEGMPSTAKNLVVTYMYDTSMQQFTQLYTSLGGKLTPFIGFKISPKDAGGSSVEPTGPVTVTVSGLEAFGLEALPGLKVLHQTVEHTVETLDASYDADTGTLTFQTTSFSPFVIAYAGEDEVDTLQWEDGGYISENKYSLYCYVLIPGCDKDSTEPNADQRWFGVGVGTISGTMIGNPNTIGLGEVTGADIKYPTEVNYTHNGMSAYPNITYKGVTYTYATPEAIKSLGKGYYTIDWFRTVIGNGANAGNNSYNSPVIRDRSKYNGQNGYGSYAYHLDGMMILNENDRYTVQFKLKDAGSTAFDSVDPETYTQRFDAGTSGSEIKVPTENEPTKYPQTKIKGGVTYRFVGWYDNEDCAGSPVDFDSLTINSNMTFYAKYEPVSANLTISKKVTGLLGDHKQQFTFQILDKSGNPVPLTTGDNGNFDIVTDANGKVTLLENGTTGKFTMASDTVVTIKNLNVGEYTIKELDATGYDTKWQVDTEDEHPKSTEATVEMKSVNRELKFTNDRDIDVDSGVLLDTLPYIVILAVVVGGGVLLMMRKRRKEDDE